MNELEKQRERKLKTEVGFRRLTLKLQTKKIKKTEILEKQDKKLSCLIIARDASYAFVNTQINDCCKTAKSNKVKCRKKRKQPKVNTKSLLLYTRLSKQYPTLSQEMI